MSLLKYKIKFRMVLRKYPAVCFILFICLLLFIFPITHNANFGFSKRAAAKRVQSRYQVYNESKLAHQLLDNLKGIEIGASSANPFGLNVLNVDVSDDNKVYREYQVLHAGTFRKVDIVASGDKLPLPDESQDFVISSQIIEHFYDPIKAIKEWLRVVKPFGYVYIIAPHQERTFDRPRARTTLAELINRHENPKPPSPNTRTHYSVWVTEDLVELCNYFKWKVVAVQDVDDKIGNGFTVVIQKDKN